MPEIDILLAAYNGEKFIAEQIDSILGQTFQDFRLLIRDDGSSDNTPAIIEEYARKFPGKIEIVHDDVLCKNPYKNFMELLKHAKADYVMFSDQDDVWLPYKIQVSLWHIKDAERRNPGLPVYVFSGLHVVDENLQSMNRFIILSVDRTEYKRFTNLLMSNIVPGCTSIFNKALYSKSKGYTDGIPFGHDSFLSALTATCGVLEHIPAAMILYRQHKNNKSGYMGVGGGHGYFVSWLIKLRKLRYSGVRMKCEFLRKNYSDIISPEKMEELNKFEALLNRNKVVKFFIMLFGKDYNLEGRLFCRIKYFLRIVLS